ncbi:PREDICTED: G-protein coupled receptor 6 [Ficedula albicollis]|nr:PREDICTED: G-protein coupled receptor 6 [Ficedula albicollis]
MEIADSCLMTQRLPRSPRVWDETDCKKIRLELQRLGSANQELSIFSHLANELIFSPNISKPHLAHQPVPGAGSQGDEQWAAGWQEQCWTSAPSAPPSDPLLFGHISSRRSPELPLRSEPPQQALHGRHPPRENRGGERGSSGRGGSLCVCERVCVRAHPALPPPRTAPPAPLPAGGGNASLELSSRPPAPAALNPWDVMLCVSGTAIACENALVVAIICYSPALRTPMFVLVGSLATADLLAGLGLILNFVFQYVIRSETVSLLTVGFLVASFAASVSSLLAITVDRYLSLYNALTYYSERTVLCIHTMLAGAWGVSLCLGLLPVLGWNCLHDRTSCSVVRPLTKSNVTLLSASFFLIFLIMLHLYIEICKIVCRHAHQIALQQHFLTASHYVTTKKGVSTLAIILGTFGASWLPFAIYCVVGDPDYPSVYTYATLLPATYNSMINPIIYAYRNQEIQRSMWVLFCGCFQAKVSFRSRSPSDV